jgi:hypothetical protein
MGNIIMRYCRRRDESYKVEAIKCDNFKQLIAWLMKNGLDKEKVKSFLNAKKGDYIVFTGKHIVILTSEIFNMLYRKDVDNGDKT